MTLGQGNLLYNRYRVIEILGRGGMGAVYRAVDESLGVDVAVKENLFTTDDYARQFRMEAVILAGIRHSNLPRVTDHFVIDDMGQYLIMDYIEGDDLRQRMEREGPISEEEAIRIGAAACDALAYLHSRKPPILHRDIKLGNIKICPDGQVYLVDFGLAKMGWEHEETMTGARAMTPGYSPPEQYGSARTDARSDIYSLGATLYAALTGVIPEDSLMRAVDGVALTPLREHRPEISVRLAAVLEKAMETAAANRYQSADAFKKALLNDADLPESEPQRLSSLPPMPETQPFKQPTGKETRQPALWWRLALFLLVAIVITSGVLIINPANRSLLQARMLALPVFTPTKTAPPLPSLTYTPMPTAAPTQQPTKASTATKQPAATASLTPQVNTPEATLALVAEPTLQGGGMGELAYAGMVGKVAQIFIIHPDGTDQRLLTDNSNGACNFDWSPDGKRIVYVSPCAQKATQYDNSGLYWLDVETGQTEALPFESRGDFEPDWSPDGTQIAFTSIRDGSMQIYTFKLSDSSLTRLTSPEEYARANYPAWSPDSTRIAFTVRRMGLFQIWTMAADGSDQQQLLRTGGAFSDYLPTWAPDGASLLFSQTNLDLTALSTLNRVFLDNGQVETISIPAPVVDASFSPDGQWIVYETNDDQRNQDIYVYSLAQNSTQRVTNSLEIEFDPAWRPANP